MGEKSIKHLKVVESLPGVRPCAKSGNRLSQLTHSEDFTDEQIHEDGVCHKVTHLGVRAVTQMEPSASRGFSASTPLTFGTR